MYNDCKPDRNIQICCGSIFLFSRRLRKQALLKALKELNISIYRKNNLTTLSTYSVNFKTFLLQKTEIAMQSMSY